jgi:hypothetical protein
MTKALQLKKKSVFKNTNSKKMKVKKYKKYRSSKNETASQAENTIKWGSNISLLYTTIHVVFLNIESVFDFQMSQHTLIHLAPYQLSCSTGNQYTYV